MNKIGYVQYVDVLLRNLLIFEILIMTDYLDFGAASLTILGADELAVLSVDVDRLAKLGVPHS